MTEETKCMDTEGPPNVICSGSLSNANYSRMWVPYHMPGSQLPGLDESDCSVCLPDRTDCLCWHCCLGFDHAPRTLPMHYDEMKQKFTVMGIFCSLSCALGYAVDRNYHNMSEIGVFVNLLASHLGEPVPVKPALPALWLKHFGGPLTVAEYRKGLPVNQLTQIKAPLVAYSLLASLDSDGHANKVVKNLKMPTVMSSQKAVNSGLYHDYYENNLKDASEEKEPKRKKVKGGLTSFIKT